MGLWTGKHNLKSSCFIRGSSSMGCSHVLCDGLCTCCRKVFIFHNPSASLSWFTYYDFDMVGLNSSFIYLLVIGSFVNLSLSSPHTKWQWLCSDFLVLF